VTVTASDGVASGSKAVVVTVANVEEGGTVSLSQRVPQTGIAVIARLSDPDDRITGTEWKWYRGGKPVPPETSTTAPTDFSITSHLIKGQVTIPQGVDAPGECSATVVASSGDSPVICRIKDAESSTYVPVKADEGNYLTAVATYKDGFVTRTSSSDATDKGDAARASSEQATQARRNANSAPSFGDDESVSRSVDENVKGASVGDPVAATDAENDLLIYELSGDGSGDFKVSNKTGQITTAKKLDYETRSSYSLTLTATDWSLASASVTVNITVNDTDDGATVIMLTGNAPVFEAEETTRSVAENTAAGTAIGDPVAATDEDGDALTYTLGGDDADAFTIDSTGQLMTSAPLDYETKMSYTVTVSASSGKADEVDAMTTVTIMVTDEGLDNAYDINESGAIERDEVVAAIQNYLAGNTAKSEVTALIRLYFGEDG